MDLQGTQVIKETFQAFNENRKGLLSALRDFTQEGYLHLSEKFQVNIYYIFEVVLG